MRTKLFRSIGFRISFISTLFTILILIVMGIFVNQHVVNYFYQQNQKEIEGKIQLIENLFQQKPSNFKDGLDEALIGHDNLVIQIKLANGQTIYNKKNNHTDLSQLIQTQNGQWINWKNKDQSYQGIMVNKVLRYGETNQNMQIIAAIEVTDNYYFLHSFKQQLLMIGLLGVIGLMFLGWLATWQGLGPIRKMAKLSENISANNLSNRLDLSNIPIELTPLATAFNDMLNRLEVSVDKLSAFSSDLAHEIRTPINNLMMQTQVSLTKPRTIEQYQDVLFSNLEEYEHLAKMISDMLFLAKSDHNLALKNKKEIDLKQEMRVLFEYFEAFASEKQIQLKQTGQASIQAEPAMIRRAFNNLISNAIKYGEPDSILEIKLSQDPQHSIIQIKNKVSAEMQTLSPLQLSRFFDRFYRLDSSRHKAEDGTGLGLAITKSIIEIHAAKIDVFIEGENIVFRIIFKAE
ncbi:two-component sensor histidine kinase [Acinetobacter sp. Ac_3412]|uniref:heavy metal sensor histidine kinase n=1 Tax=Acinetobacter sp. Ac_3412 TaxID=1848935 RepID=UPI0014900DA1|nr:heavy metal sensor histidine kinase [Acinetobacter sp. Ac_3412]NNP75625.1 two-component sensor histidine kinase [Acinetobacter sp. Ac_3412]